MANCGSVFSSFVPSFIWLTGRKKQVTYSFIHSFVFPSLGYVSCLCYYYSFIQLSVYLSVGRMIMTRKLIRAVDHIVVNRPDLTVLVDWA